MSVLSDVEQALRNLNGAGSLADIYYEYDKINSNPVHSTVRRTLQAYSSDSITYQNKRDLFFSVEGIGNGIWGLRNYEVTGNLIPIPENKTPARRLFLSNRIIRDTALAKTIKSLIGNQCQLCDEKILLSNGESYVEAHHIMPLGKPYNGPDIKENIIVVCPNCHIKCDYKSILLNITVIKNNLQNIGIEFINFHNDIYKVSII